MTEQEARTKWCPQARVVTIHDDAGMIAGPANRTEVCGEDHFTKPMGSFCIGSACMAWRAREAVTREVRTDLGELPPGYYENEASWVQIPRLPGHEGLRWRQTISAATGYCGLAGSPQ